MTFSPIVRRSTLLRSRYQAFFLLLSFCLMTSFHRAATTCARATIDDIELLSLSLLANAGRAELLNLVVVVSRAESFVVRWGRSDDDDGDERDVNENSKISSSTFDEWTRQSWAERRRSIRVRKIYDFFTLSSHHRAHLPDHSHLAHRPSSTIEFIILILIACAPMGVVRKEIRDPSWIEKETRNSTSNWITGRIISIACA